MKKIAFDLDYQFCPKGHLWTFVPVSTLYSDIFWCEKCDCFYEPSVRKITKEILNKNFSSDRASEIISLAKFYNWRSSLSKKDMEIYKKLVRE